MNKAIYRNPLKEIRLWLGTTEDLRFTTQKN
jgi:hypothetical protein